MERIKDGLPPGLPEGKSMVFGSLSLPKWDLNPKALAVSRCLSRQPLTTMVSDVREIEIPDAVKDRAGADDLHSAHHMGMMTNHQIGPHLRQLARYGPILGTWVREILVTPMHHDQHPIRFAPKLL
jgi:hypothetical protein